MLMVDRKGKGRPAYRNFNSVSAVLWSASLKPALEVLYSSSVDYKAVISRFWKTVCPFPRCSVYSVLYPPGMDPLLPILGCAWAHCLP